MISPPNKPTDFPEQMRALIALFDQGLYEEALARGEALAAQFPDVSFIPNLLGAANDGLGRQEQAAACFRAAVQLQPDYAEAHTNLGVVLHDLGKYTDAVASFRTALQFAPGDTSTHASLANALRNLGRLDEAVATYREALQLQPDNAEAHNNLGIVLYDLGRLEEAVASYLEALRIEPNNAEAHNNLGMAQNSRGRREQAVASYRQALQIKPDYVEAHTNLGDALRDLGDREEAVASYRKSLQLKPGNAEALNNLGIVLHELEMPEEAVACYRDALLLEPSHLTALNNLGNVLHDLGKPAEAVACYREALRLEPTHAIALSNLGTALNDLGEPVEAIRNYEDALSLKPDRAEWHWKLSIVKKYAAGDPHMDQMLQLLERPNLPDRDRLRLCFALGKAYDDAGGTDQAFAYILEGNRLRMQELQYKRSSDQALFARIKSAFSDKASFSTEVEQAHGTTSRRPVFILGMPRSGTSLVEQVLASHSEVFGAGELKLLGELVNFAEWNATPFTATQVRSIRENYLSGLDKIGAPEAFITDKMPHNFLCIGFIIAALPEAVIVHVKRDARATCWSNFKHGFLHKGSGFSCDLEDLAEYYRMYSELMLYWHERFPGRIYDLDYEALTENQENETRKLLEHVGLQWEDQCLAFCNTKRTIRTPSAQQVRQKMYQGSSEEWRKYEKFLQPMVELLKGL